MSEKFEKLLDYLVNEEMDKANELFHEIVVEKSRTIYENLVSEETEEDEEMDESSEEDDEEPVDESFGEEESVHELAGDASDNFVDSVVDHDAMDADGQMDAGMDMGGGEEGLDSVENVIMDIKDTVDELKAEFDAMLANQTEDDFGGDLDNVDFGDEEGDDEADFDDEEGDDEADFDDEEDDENEGMDDEESDEDEADESFVREYREVVGKNYPFGKNSEEGAHTKSSINANPSDRPSTKASAKNIAQGGGKGEGKMDGTSPAAASKGLVGGAKGKFTDGSTLNVDGKQTKGYSQNVKKPAKGESSVNDKNVLPK